jgi:hypothetical protein
MQKQNLSLTFVFKDFKFKGMYHGLYLLQGFGCKLGLEL